MVHRNFVTRLYSDVQLAIWRAAAPSCNAILRNVLRVVLRPARARSLTSQRRVRVVGLMSTATGIGESARLCVHDLNRSGFEVETCNVSKAYGVDQRVPFEARPTAPTDAGGLSIYHLNPPMALTGLILSGPRRYYSGMNIAYWAWELPELTADWLASLPYFDGFFVPSRFTRDAIARHTSKPVVVVPHPVAGLREAERTVHNAPGKDRRSFRVLSIFNCRSSLYRKNPGATIAAFKAAFADSSEAELVLKISDGHDFPADVAWLRAQIGDAKNIRLVDEMSGQEQLTALMASADAYVSLHRSEGFGLTVADAIMQNVPVVVTNWSGTTDFCLPGLAYTIDYTLVPVQDPHPAYSTLRAVRWAEPSVTAAAERLREIRENPGLAQERARTLRANLLAYLDANRYEHGILKLKAAPSSDASKNTPSTAQGAVWPSNGLRR